MGAKKAAALLAALILAVVIAACGSGDDDQAAAGGDSAAASEKFPPDKYPPEVFGDLEGEIRWYDTDGGSFQRAQLDTIYKDFEELTGVPVIPDLGDGTTARFFAAMENGDEIPWSFFEFYSLNDGHRAAELGYLEKLDTDVVPVENVEDGAYDEYGVQRSLFGQVLTWNTEKFPEDGPQPQGAADFYDFEKFPGKRCAPQYSDQGMLEQALMADGVPHDEIYPLDVDRAFRKLDELKGKIIFNVSPDSQIQSLLSGECDVAMVFSGRVYNAVTVDNAPLKMTWNDAMYSPGYMGVPKGAPNKEAGMALIAMYVTNVEANKALVSKIPYPTPLKIIPLDEYPAETQPWLPVGENVANALAKDVDYYDENAVELDKRFTAWLAD